MVHATVPCRVLDFRILIFASAPSANGTQAWLFAIGGMLTVFSVVLIASTAQVYWRSVKVADRYVEIPKAVTGEKTVDLATVSGVGLLFQSGTPGTRAPMTWLPCVWTGDGSQFERHAAFLYAHEDGLDTWSRSKAKTSKKSLGCGSFRDYRCLSCGGVGRRMVCIRRISESGEGPDKFGSFGKVAQGEVRYVQRVGCTTSNCILVSRWNIWNAGAQGSARRGLETMMMIRPRCASPQSYGYSSGTSWKAFDRHCDLGSKVFTHLAMEFYKCPAPQKLVHLVVIDNSTCEV